MPTKENTANTNQEKRSKHNNAVKHGVFAKDFVHSDEDVEEFRALRREVYKEYGATGPTEKQFASAIAEWIWRKRRYLRLMTIRSLIDEGRVVDLDQLDTHGSEEA